MSAGIRTDALRLGHVSMDQDHELHEVTLPGTHEFEGVIGASTPPDYLDIDAPRSDRAKRERLDALERAGLTKMGVNIHRLEGPALRLVEKLAIEEAREKLKRSGMLLRTRLRDDTGRVVTVASGDPRVAWAPFMAPAQRIRFNVHASQHREGGRWVENGRHLAEVPNT